MRGQKQFPLNRSEVRGPDRDYDLNRKKTDSRILPVEHQAEEGTTEDIVPGKKTGPIVEGKGESKLVAAPPEPHPPVVAPFPPQFRQTPTAAGGILNLAPHESATERAVELALKLAAMEGENRLLFARMKKLEADLEQREKELAAVNQEVDLASGDLSKARLELVDLRRQLGDTRSRLRQVEKEEIETMRLVIAALEKFLNNQPPVGKPMD